MLKHFHNVHYYVPLCGCFSPQQFDREPVSSFTPGIFIVWLMRLSKTDSVWPSDEIWQEWRLASLGLTCSCWQSQDVCVCVSHMCVCLYYKNPWCSFSVIPSKWLWKTLTGLQSQPNNLHSVGSRNAVSKYTGIHTFCCCVVSGIYHIRLDTIWYAQKRDSSSLLHKFINKWLAWLWRQLPCIAATATCLTDTILCKSVRSPCCVYMLHNFLLVTICY